MMQTPEEMYQQATEILTAMNREQMLADPILDLIVWAHGDVYPDDEQMQEKFQHLMNLSETQMLKVIEGPHQTNGLPDLTPEGLEHLQGTPRQQAKAEATLRREIKQMLKNVALTLPAETPETPTETPTAPETQQAGDQNLADRVRARREARQE